MRKEMTDEELEKLANEFNELIWRIEKQKYEPLCMGKWWHLFSFSFCAFISVSYIYLGDAFSAAFMAFMSGANLVVYLEKSED